MNQTQMQQLCSNHKNRYVLVRTVEDYEYDGIIESVDDENLYLAVPDGGSDREEVCQVDRQSYGGELNDGSSYYGTPYFGYPYYPRPRRFRRVVLPLSAVSALGLLPYY